MNFAVLYGNQKTLYNLRGNSPVFFVSVSRGFSEKNRCKYPGSSQGYMFSWILGGCRFSGAGLIWVGFSADSRSVFGPNAIQMIPQWYQNHIRMTLNWYSNDLEMTPKMVPNWYPGDTENDTKILPQWYQTGTQMIRKWYQTDTEIIPRSHQHDAKMILKSYQNRTKIVGGGGGYGLGV